jgi:exodeoxyribonuclease VIII
MISRNPIDGRVHWSELRAMLESPKRYLHACRKAREMTTPMTVGAVADCIVFGDRGYAVFEGNGDKRAVRNGQRWEDFQRANEGKIICIPSEYEAARDAAHAVLTDPVARQLLEGCEFQRVLRWDALGLPFAAGIPGVRGGLDAWNPRGCELTRGRPYIADLKCTATVEPDALERHIRSMRWHGQLAHYRAGAQALGLDAQAAILIAVESSAPHDVVCVVLDDELLARGELLVSRAAERLRECEASGHWPGYVQTLISVGVGEYGDE